MAGPDGIITNTVKEIQMANHIHVYVGGRTRDATTPEVTKANMTSVRQGLMPLSSKIASTGSSAEDMKLKNACFKAEELIDQARKVLFDAV